MRAPVRHELPQADDRYRNWLRRSSAQAGPESVAAIRAGARWRPNVRDLGNGLGQSFPGRKIALTAVHTKRSKRSGVDQAFGRSTVAAQMHAMLATLAFCSVRRKCHRPRPSARRRARRCDHVTHRQGLTSSRRGGVGCCRSFRIDDLRRCARPVNLISLCLRIGMRPSRAKPVRQPRYTHSSRSGCDLSDYVTSRQHVDPPIQG
jgi:hypothetical protein